MFFYTFSVQTIDLMCQRQLSFCIDTDKCCGLWAAIRPEKFALSSRGAGEEGGRGWQWVTAPQISLGPPITITTRYLASAETVAAKAYDASTCARAGNFPLFLELISTT